MLDRPRRHRSKAGRSPEIESEGLPRAILRRYRILTAPERRRGLLLLALASAMTLLEWLGGASVFAFVALLSRPDALTSVPALASLMARVSTDPGSTRVAALSLMGVFHLGRIGVLLALGRARARISGHIGNSLSGRLVDAHLAAPLSSHTKRSSAERIRDVAEYAPTIWGAVDGTVYAATEAVIVLGLLSLLASVRPVDIAIAGLVLVLFVASTLRLTRAAATRHAVRTREVEARSLRALQQLYGAWREVKVLGRETFFRDGFVSGREEALGLQVHAETLALVPRSVLEAAFVLGAGALALLSMSGAGGAAGAFPVLGLYAYTGFRAVPAVERILRYLAIVRWNIAVSEPLVGELEQLARMAPETPSGPLPFADRITLEGVGFTHPGAPTPSLQAIRFDVPRGTSLAIVGRTGAGKSTLLDILLGLLAPDEGRICIDGVPLEGGLLRSWRQRIGYVPQAAFLLDDTVRRNVAFGLPDAEIDDARVRRALEVAQAGDFAAALPLGLDETIGEKGGRLSGGERQRIAIARALYRDPDVLCLDEATAALDPATERELAEAMRRLASRTLVMVTHRMTTAQRCDRIAVLSAGRLVAWGTWDELLEGCAEFRELAAEAAGDEEATNDPAAP